MKFSTTTVTTLFLTTLVSLSTTEARIGQTHALAAHRRLDEEEEEALGDSNQVTMDNFHIDNYTCGTKQLGVDTNTNVYYPPKYDPTSKKVYPLVLFERGSDGWDKSYDNWLQAIASKELIVIAPTTNKNVVEDPVTKDDECKHDTDLWIAYNWAIKKDTLNKKIDFNRIGVAGHSAGGKHIPTFISDYSGRMRIQVALLSHGAEDITDTAKAASMIKNKIPSMFTTSADDKIVLPAHVKSWFDKLPYDANGPNVFVNLNTGGHNEPHETYKLSQHTGYFLACHLNGKYCDKAYNDNLCKDAGAGQCVYTHNWKPKTDTVAAIDDNDADAATDADVATNAATDVDVATDAADSDADVDADAADADVADADADADAGTDAGTDADTYN